MNLFDAKFIGVVLAGGKSTRMGTDKSQLIYKNKTFLDISIENLKNAGCDSIYISVANQDLVNKISLKTNIKTNIKTIEDQIQNIGPLSGVLSAFTALTNLLYEKYAVFIPTDMPFLTSNIINNLMLQIANDKSTNAIHYENHVFPFIIKNSEKNAANVIEIINKQIMKKSFSLTNILIQLNSRAIPVKQDDDKNKFFHNINRQEDFFPDLFNKQTNKQTSDNNKK